MASRRNFSRFYAVAKARGVDLEQHKESLVLEFTDGRTSHLHEMKPEEYREMCDCLQYGSPAGRNATEYREALRRARSAVLVRMQRLGVDTSDRTFSAVNRFCQDSRIAGKQFGMLDVDELKALVPKLEMMLRKKAAAAVRPRYPMPIYIRTGGIKS